MRKSVYLFQSTSPPSHFNICQLHYFCILFCNQKASNLRLNLYKALKIYVLIYFCPPRVLVLHGGLLFSCGAGASFVAESRFQVGGRAPVVAACGLSSCDSPALELGLSGCGTRLSGAGARGSMWSLFRTGIEPMSPTLAGGFLSTTSLLPQCLHLLYYQLKFFLQQFLQEGVKETRFPEFLHAEACFSVAFVLKPQFGLVYNYFRSLSFFIFFKLNYCRKVHKTSVWYGNLINLINNQKVNAPEAPVSVFDHTSFLLPKR